MSTSELYPAGPSNVSAELTRPTSAYKQRAWWAVASLALFVLLYLALASWFVWTSYRLLDEAFQGGGNNLLNFLVGGCAAFLALFMLKALVFVKRGSMSDDIEVTQAEQPRLFEFLYRLADEAGAPRPKRVYLSARVNAAVFYDLSVINLIFPSKKNLEIGLSLVNVLTLSETKAVLAHEFGHFAQRSMAIGSWVYIAQQIASHVIAKRDMLDGFLQGLSRTDLRIAWIGWLLSLIVWSIRSLLDTILRLVVLAQRALSRQMEFQADLVAVSLTGSDELIHALHKLQAADEAWDRTLSFTNSELRQERMPNDLFAVQTQIITKLARIFDDESYGKVPALAGDAPATHRVFKTSFAQPPQMWSTHPASSDREENAKKTYLAAPHDARSAWLLFDNVDDIKAKVANNFIGENFIDEVKAQRATAQETVQALDEFYNLPQYDPRYRGAYLGRTLTRHVARAEQLYENALQNTDIKQALASLYAPDLGDKLEKLRELEEEKGILEALFKKVYQATGGRIVYRGREIPRGDLPEAIAEVSTEETAVRQQISDHDSACRSAHLAAAEQLGGNWHAYLKGLINLLHYTEHSLADLRDAQGLLDNVTAVVTADGKVSTKELKLLLTTANSLHVVLSAIHAQKNAVTLDATLLKKLKAESWPAMQDDFTLPPASNDNINDWMRVIDGWVNDSASTLAALNKAVLETLIHTEDNIARQLRDDGKPEAAPAASAVPPTYATLISGQERKRQEKLGLWDSFMVADGLPASVARLLVAGSIVGAVLGFSSVTATTTTLTIYNGLARDVNVHVGKEKLSLPAFAAREIEIELTEKTNVEAKTAEGELIESFAPTLTGHSQHYIYNVAGASPLVEWAAVYGSDTKQEPRLLGAARWTISAVDVYFSEPPESVNTKSGGATKWVLDGGGDRVPEEIFSVLPSDEDKKKVALAHLKWDKPDAPNTQKWKDLAK